MPRKLIEKYTKWGLNVIVGKTKYLCVQNTQKNLQIENEQNIQG